MSTLSHGRKGLQELLQRNKKWAHDIKKQNPTYFSKLVDQQSPEVLWIGTPTFLLITDLNALSVLEYAVTALKVKHIIVCGHYGCGGVNAAMTQKEFGLVDNWLRSIKDIYSDNANVLGRISDDKKRSDLLTELNVAKAVYNVCHTRIVQTAWQSGQELHIHGWCYRLKDGIIRDLKICISGEDQVEDIYRKMQEKESPELCLARTFASISTGEKGLHELLERNKKWAAKVQKEDPTYFAKLEHQQAPEVLWIGDAYRPDCGCLGGHYGCGGVNAALTQQEFGLVDNWLRNIKDLYITNHHQFERITDEKERQDLMTELNVAKSVYNICHTRIVQNAWLRGQELNVHGWCYRLKDGIIRDLKIRVTGEDQVEAIYRKMLDKEHPEA
ncbi:hypothetical protein DYB26_000970 [Aphanomyces astaci]|uniref:carbonic anhydrase n=1 Tax=Aphanomyces astaci TaxID=112090 RepID=A0A3R6XHN1_APHAT|nr:hypothetical protein DYB26_000970 [Aphanomyces astaci]